MELPAYHYGQHDTSLDDNLYEEIDATKHSLTSTTRENVQDPVRQKAKPNTAKKTGEKQRGVNVVLAIAIVAVLALAVIAIVVSVLLTSNSNQEIQSLQLEIENLREMLNQTGDNSNQEIQSLQQVLENQIEMLNQTGDNSSQEIQSLQLEIENLRGMLNEAGDKYNKKLQSLTLEIEMLNQTGDNSSQEIQSLQLEIENLRDMLNQTGDNSSQEIQSLQLEIENLRGMLNEAGDSYNKKLQSLTLEIEMLNQTGDNSSQEIQSLQLEIENLREMLNQTGDNSNQEIQSLQLEIENLREMLNQTGDNSNQEIQSLQLEIENLREMLNQTGDSLAIQVSTLRNENQERNDNLTREVQYLNNTVQQHSLEILQLRTISGLLRGTIEHPASSCSEITQDSPSGEYWIQNNNTNSPVQVYCDMNPRNCSCNSTGGWTRVANLDMTDPSQQCPDGFRLVNRTTAPLRTCSRPDNNFVGCVSTTFPVHGIEYSHVCGRVIGYQFYSINAFWSYYKNNQLSIDDFYVDGVSLTHGHAPRQHIWTFAAAADETRAQKYVCPCTRPDLDYTGTVPPFIGQDYFCETGSRDGYQGIFYSDDPLWNGQGCGNNSNCCSFNNPPWFCKQLPQPTTDVIELRLCLDQDGVNEDNPIEMVEIYIK